MARKSTFVKGSSTFTCTCCGHLTRWTGEQGVDSKTCVPCWDLAGIENAFQDYSEEDFLSMNYDKEVKSNMLLIRKRSGAEFEKAKKAFDMLAAYFPADDETLPEATEEAPAEAVSARNGAVAICRNLFKINPEIARKDFVVQAIALGVCKATAGTQYNRIKKEAKA
jgi:hypothetical protein